MLRKKNPQQTIENIITVSHQLFAQKGYDKTSMQDIVDALGMSKGAIFHHFKSKEELFNKVMEQQRENAMQAVNKWLNNMEGATAKEKIIGLLEQNMRDQQIRMMDKTMAEQIENPQIVTIAIQDSLEFSAPIFSRLLEDGNEDGSITTKYPDECAEMFLLMVNIWCDPVICKCDASKIRKRLEFLQQVMKAAGVDVVTDKMVDEYANFLEELYKGRI